MQLGRGTEYALPCSLAVANYEHYVKRFQTINNKNLKDDHSVVLFLCPFLGDYAI